MSVWEMRPESQTPGVAGRKPRAAFESELRARLDAIMSSCPSDSAARLIVRRKRNGEYVGLIRVLSQQGKFIARATAERAEIALEGAFRSLAEQIDEWRRRRIFPS